MSKSKRRFIGPVSLAFGLAVALVILFRAFSRDGVIEIHNVEHIEYPSVAIQMEDGPSALLLHYMQKNEDVVCVIRLPGTLLEAPVVQSAPEDAYLRMNLDGEYLTAGTPFMTADSHIGGPGNNVVVFAHNMPDGTLFGALMGYKDIDFLREHPVLELDTLSGTRKYHVFSVFYANASSTDYDYARFSLLDEVSGPEFISQARVRSLYDVVLDATPDDEYLTLSTCTNEAGGTNGRFVVVGRLLREDEPPTADIKPAEAPLIPELFRGII